MKRITIRNGVLPASGNPTKWIIVNQRYQKVLDEEFTDENAAQLVVDRFNKRARRKEDMVFTMGKTY